jgi:hypothetical protein
MHDKLNIHKKITTDYYDYGCQLDLSMAKYFNCIVCNLLMIP